jgi:hypothetical protein
MAFCVAVASSRSSSVGIAVGSLFCSLSPHSLSSLCLAGGRGGRSNLEIGDTLSGTNDAVLLVIVPRSAMALGPRGPHVGKLVLFL